MTIDLNELLGLLEDVEIEMEEATDNLAHAQTALNDIRKIIDEYTELLDEGEDEEIADD